MDRKSAARLGGLQKGINYRKQKHKALYSEPQVVCPKPEIEGWTKDTKDRIAYNPDQTIDEAVMFGANIHIEQLDDSHFMLIMENLERRWHFNIFSRSGRANVDLTLMESDEHIPVPSTPAKQELAETYWWCPECKEEISPSHVTHQEYHDVCGTHVEAKLLTHPSPELLLTDERKNLLWQILNLKAELTRARATGQERELAEAERTAGELLKENLF